MLTMPGGADAATELTGGVTGVPPMIWEKEGILFKSREPEIGDTPEELLLNDLLLTIYNYSLRIHKIKRKL